MENWSEDTHQPRGVVWQQAGNRAPPPVVLLDGTCRATRNAVWPWTTQGGSRSM